MPSHYSNAAFDSAAKSYLASADIKSQRAATKKMAGILLRDTPVITSYFISFVTISAAKLQNYQAEAISHVRLAKSSFS